jgi:hypothetical protein
MHQLITKDPTAQIVTANKKLVEALLAMNTHNRNPKKTGVDRLTTDLNENRFLLTASGIGVSKTGLLLDGQHRLLAMRAAGYPPVKFVLCTGLDDDSQMVVDRHIRRVLADVLSLHMNMSISTRVVALVNAVFAHGALRGKNSDFISADTKSRADQDIAEFIAQHNDILFDFSLLCVGLRASVAAALFVYVLNDCERGIQFALDVSKGLNLVEDHPAYRLRTAINRLKTSNGSAGRMELFCLSVSAVIAHANGRTVKALKESKSWTNAPPKWNCNVLQETK